MPKSENNLGKQMDRMVVLARSQFRRPQKKTDGGVTVRVQDVKCLVSDNQDGEGKNDSQLAISSLLWNE